MFCKAFEYFEHDKWAHVNRVMSKMKLVGVSVRPGVSVATLFGILSFSYVFITDELLLWYFHWNTKEG